MTAAVLLMLVVAISDATVTSTITDDRAYELIWQLDSEDPGARHEARARLMEMGDPSLAPALVEMIFFSRAGRDDARLILESLFDVTPDSVEVHPYKFWLEEIGRREEITPRPGYLELKSRLYSKIDPAFAEFLDSRHPRSIRPEEIVFGGVRKDGIPALDDPAMVAAEQASWMRDDEIVFGLYVDGEAKAYPRRIIDWHEMINDVVGGVPVTLAWCTLCGSAIAYEARVGDRTFTFGTSGLLYRSNKLMYDRQTNTLWSQISGQPVFGPLADSELELDALATIVTTWRDWKTVHPDTTVLSRDTGFARDYDNPPYTSYFASPDLMFPVWNRDERLPRKEFVWATELDGATRAWRVSDLRSRPVLNDRVGDRPVLLLTNPRSGGVRMYEGLPDGQFLRVENGAVVTDRGEQFTISEETLDGDDGIVLNRLPGHEAFWFAWYATHPDTELYEP